MSRASPFRPLLLAVAAVSLVGCGRSGEASRKPLPPPVDPAAHALAAPPAAEAIAAPPTQAPGAEAAPTPSAPPTVEYLVHDRGQQVWLRIWRHPDQDAVVAVGWSFGEPLRGAVGPLTLRGACQDERREIAIAAAAGDGLFHGALPLGASPCLLTLRVPDVGSHVVAMPLTPSRLQPAKDAFRVALADQRAGDVRCEPAAQVPLRRGDEVEVEVVGAGNEAVIAPVEGRIGRGDGAFPRLLGTIGPEHAAMTLVPKTPPARDKVALPWRPVGPADAPTAILALQPATPWQLSALDVAIGARVRAGDRIAELAQKDALAVRLPLQARELPRLGLRPDGSSEGAAVDLVLRDETRRPLLVEARLVPALSETFALMARLPSGHGLTLGQRVRALLRHGPAHPTRSVRASAVVRRGAERWVFLQVGGEAFVRRDVVLGADGGDRIELLEGPEADACVVVSGHDVVEAALAAARVGDD
ncbi:MAG: hypothetical protein H6747_02900 [Deltaproteobacteria bacterium]|nr:hypothetical protein [Deltaproteobacteria bacterium]